MSDEKGKEKRPVKPKDYGEVVWAYIEESEGSSDRIITKRKRQEEGK